MLRTLSIATALTLLPAALAAAQTDGETTGDPVLVATADPIDVGDDAYAEDFEDEEYLDDEEVEFCGGGEETQVDLAYYELESNPDEARRMLVDALRAGGVEDWQRGHALAYLAEAQLRLGQYRSAVINYRKALHVDPDGVTEAARVGLATALYLGGAREAARREATEASDGVCDDRWAQVPCYAAQRILEMTERGEAHDAAAENARRLRDTHTEYATGFDDVDARLRGETQATS